MRLNLKEAQAAIEAVLFAAGEAVEVDMLSQITEIDKSTLCLLIERMNEEMYNRPSGLQIIQIEDAFQLCTKPEYFGYISKLVEPKRTMGLSNAALETLSIVAYNQPVTRSSIEFIRGVNSDGALARLVERGLVEECGRLATPGKPLIYATTQEFLRCFGLKALADLPDINADIQIGFEQPIEE